MFHVPRLRSPIVIGDPPGLGLARLAAAFRLDGSGGVSVRPRGVRGETRCAGERAQLSTTNWGETSARELVDLWDLRN